MMTILENKYREALNYMDYVEKLGDKASLKDHGAFAVNRWHIIRHALTTLDRMTAGDTRWSGVVPKSDVVVDGYAAHDEVDKAGDTLDALDDLKAVLCDPEGRCCIDGSDEDRNIINKSLMILSNSIFTRISLEKMKMAIPEDIDESNRDDISHHSHCVGYNAAIDDVIKSALTAQPAESVTLDETKLKNDMVTFVCYRGYLHNEDTPITYKLLRIGAEKALEYIKWRGLLNPASLAQPAASVRPLCHDVDFGTYQNAVSLNAPWGEVITIDICMIPEAKFLWDKGIKTLECCCGHGNHSGYIAVSEANRAAMEELGYKPDPKSPRCFIAKSSQPKLPDVNAELLGALKEGAIAKAAYLGDDYDPKECQIQKAIARAEQKGGV